MKKSNGAGILVRAHTRAGVKVRSYVRGGRGSLTSKRLGKKDIGSLRGTAQMYSKGDAYSKQYAISDMLYASDNKGLGAKAKRAIEKRYYRFNDA